MEVLKSLLTYDLGKSPPALRVRGYVRRGLASVRALDWKLGLHVGLRFCGGLALGVVGLMTALFVLALHTPAPSRFVLDEGHRGIETPSHPDWHRFSDWVNHRKYAVLTFDDGPMGDAMDDRFLAILRKHHAHAIFFLVCNKINADTQPALGRMLHDGHMLGNHSFDHLHVSSLSYDQAFQQIDTCSERIANVTGHRPYFFRPPFGHSSPNVTRASRVAGVQQVFWSASSYDYWYGEPEKIAQFSVEETKDMSILIMHERKGTAAALDTVLTQLEEKGFTFVLPDKAVM